MTLLGTALCDRHVQRREHQLGAKMVGHGPPDHLTAEHIEHDGQEPEPGPGRHVGDIGDPDAVRCIGGELAFDPVRSRTAATVRARGARAPAPAHPGQDGLTHQPSHALATDPAAAPVQFGMDPRHPIGAPRSLVDGPDRAA